MFTAQFSHLTHKSSPLALATLTGYVFSSSGQACVPKTSAPHCLPQSPELGAGGDCECAEAQKSPCLVLHICLSNVAPHVLLTLAWGCSCGTDSHRPGTGASLTWSQLPRRPSALAAYKSQSLGPSRNCIENPNAGTLF